MSVRVPYGQNEQGSIWLSLDPRLFEAFPREVIWNNTQLTKKDEFHITLLHAKSASELANVPNEEVASFFNSFVETHPVKLLSFIGDFRYVEEEEKKTVVVRCIVSNLNGLFLLFNRTLHVQLPVQAAHVTLYTLQKNAGIHINSDEKMESLQRVGLPELSAALLNM